MSKGSNFTEGFILGAIGGVLLGILCAPDSGDETRKKLFQMKKDNDDLIKDTKEKTEKMVDHTLKAIDNGFEKIQTIIEDNKKAKS